VDKGYEVYSLADPCFYDSPALTRGDDRDYAIAERPAPEGWRRAALEDWLAYTPENSGAPDQGWKIHASACLDNSEAVLGATWEYCVARRIPFKFIRSAQLFFLRNGKYAERSASGKLVTIYPRDDAQFEQVLRELGAALEGQPGPYILSDLRWGAGPLYVRYGGFKERWCIGADGRQELAIENPDGELVPDRREPVFRTPEWVAIPDCLGPALAARGAATVEDVPYTFEQALHYSNGGGLYTGVDKRTGEKVVIKEARPHAGLAVDRADAVARLGREREMLEHLAGLDVVPALRDTFTIDGHHFLVEEFIDGASLRAQLVERYPLTQATMDAATAVAYTDWAVAACERVDRAVEALHGRGVVVGDVHPDNMLMRPDGTVVLIDFEVATHLSEDRRPTLGDPGFVAPRDRNGFDIDRYALACLRLFMFMPITTLIGLAPTKARHLAEQIAEAFPVPAGFLEDAVSTICGPVDRIEARRHGIGGRPEVIEPDAAGWERARESMTQAILASATPERDDRLFPGDIRQFDTGALNVAYGAAGVLYALAATGGGRHADFEDWLVTRATRPQPGTHLGFYDGLHGVAHVLNVLGRRDEALQVLDICDSALDGALDRLRLDLYGGLAGIGLNLLHFATETQDAAFWSATARVADIIAARLGDADSVSEVSGGAHPYAGLMLGGAGPALFFLRLHEQRGDDALLDLAATALRQDIRRCVVRPEDESLEVNEGWRTMPYLADGSVGIGTVIADYLEQRDDSELELAAAAIHRAAEAKFYVEPGLFYGRAGMITYLSREHAPGAAGHDPVVAAHIRRLAWHALTYQGHLSFPGEYLLRLSMDLASGTAGVLLAVGSALRPGGAHLPFLDFLGHERVACTQTPERHEGRR
jgi:tRNA A-37 threonylcarbamoyl transferase component Bud32